MYCFQSTELLTLELQKKKNASKVKKRQMENSEMSENSEILF